MSRLDDLGEFELIRRLAGSAADVPGVVVGPGDDAAVLRPEPGRDLVVTTDTFVAGRHWLDDWIEPGALGARLARANLSDLAAMAARPRWAVVAMGLAPAREAAWVEAVQLGFAAALAQDGAVVVGGNVSGVASEEWLTVTLVGDVAPGLAWTRGGARPGDALVVTGRPGRAGAAVGLVRALGEGAQEAAWAPLLEAWRAPASRVDLARALAAGGAVTAALDVSDGLAGDLGHLCESSGVGAELADAAWPPDPALEAAARRLGRDPFALRLGASDDYELLMAVAPDGLAGAEAVAREAGVPWSVIGSVTGSPGVIERILADGRRAAIEPRSYDHFG